MSDHTFSQIIGLFQVLQCVTNRTSNFYERTSIYFTLRLVYILCVWRLFGVVKLFFWFFFFYTERNYKSNKIFNIIFIFNFSIWKLSKGIKWDKSISGVEGQLLDPSRFGDYNKALEDLKLTKNGRGRAHVLKFSMYISLRKISLF